MVAVLLLTLGLFALVMLGMGVGVMVSGRALKGSCGGVGGPDCACERQGKPVGDCGKTFAAVGASDGSANAGHHLSVYGQGPVEPRG